MKRFIVMIEGSNLRDSEVRELPRLPDEGDPIETKFGTCIVTEATPLPDGKQYAGRIVCRFGSRAG